MDRRFLMVFVAGLVILASAVGLGGYELSVQRSQIAKLQRAIAQATTASSSNSLRTKVDSMESQLSDLGLQVGKWPILGSPDLSATVSGLQAQAADLQTEATCIESNFEFMFNTLNQEGTNNQQIYLPGYTLCG
jgi:hypothetical protein